MPWDCHVPFDRLRVLAMTNFSLALPYEGREGRQSF
jgi:hypothetical protein